ncbi:RagB/SusD family nutrient uptake outer membrane protein [Belliella aquatica]|uniref:Membrane protein n=1 Tax=Belliella aquatica TaxID=1323734 RepID=A0ABQ1MSZ9_9BACT|nr:RagB/SusD family nutrient uptake outer membrane protein [Belliella aquatica]MCH7406434.1 RagB/SusD family nutrient uptake outer membrane protein [Belliella aquatica]GGC45992.1 membrane protein [Belliella aquatica]
MKNNKFIKSGLALILAAMFSISSCSDLLDEPLQNQIIADGTNYSQSENMILLLYGAYAELYSLQWESFPIISVRGDDVTPAGDQFPLTETDLFRYDRSFWMYNSTWLNLYTDILYWNGAMEEIRKYQEAGARAETAEQYIAEVKVMKSFELLQLARLWGTILIPNSSQPSDLFNVELSSFDEVMEYISSQMDEAIPNLPNVHPNQRSDIRGGMTRATALAIKAQANLELKNWQEVAEATSEIISSNQFALEPDYYQLFKVPGKLNRENVFEFQYSDFGTATGTVTRYLWDFFGPASWTPTVAGASQGWGFWSPTTKYIKFMLDRNERTRLETTVIFTPDGIAEIESDPNYSNLPNWISNVTPDGDVFNNHPRYNFMSGKHYLPSTQLTPGRFSYGENKNLTVIRYSEILLMHAEAIVNGANTSSISATAAVNLVRNRAGLGPVSMVTLETVLDEKFAEFGMEWGIRFYDLMRYNRGSELNFGGRNFQQEFNKYLPYPLEQQDILPQLTANTPQG